MRNGSRKPSDTMLTLYSQPIFTVGKSIRVNTGSWGGKLADSRVNLPNGDGTVMAMGQ